MGCKRRTYINYINFSVSNQDTACNGVRGADGSAGNDWPPVN